MLRATPQYFTTTGRVTR